MSGFFNQDNPFWRFINTLTDIVLMNLVFVICCLPVVTIGPVWTAMYYTMMKSVRRERGYVFKNFLHSLKQNFVQGLVCWLVLLIFGGTAGFSIWSMWKQTENGGNGLFLFWVSVFVLLFVICLAMYIFPALSRFNFSVGELFAFAAVVGVKYFYITLALLAIFAAAIFACYLYLPLLVLGMPVLFIFVSSFLIEKIFKAYMPKFDENDDTVRDQWYYE